VHTYEVCEGAQISYFSCKLLPGNALGTTSTITGVDVF
jgi:hypothetical protein